MKQRGLAKVLLRLAADDIFVSYSRGDASIYADGLADALVRSGFTVFIDRLGTEANEKIPASLLAKLHGSSMLVLVGSPAAARSVFVGQEVAEFDRRRGSDRIVPIDFEGALPRAAWYAGVEGIAMEAEPLAALETGDVSPRVVARIEKAFRYTRSKDRLRHLTTAALVLLGSLLALSGGAGWVARQQLQAAGEAEQRAVESGQRAASAASQAAVAEARAVDASASAAAAMKHAVAMDAVASAAQQRASDAQQRAGAALEQARQQERVARSRQLAVRSGELLASQFDLAALLAVAAADAAPTLEARDALDAVLSLEPRLLHQAGNGERVSAMTVGDDGRVDVVAKSSGVLSIGADGLVRPSPSTPPDATPTLAPSTTLVELQRRPNGSAIALLESTGFVTVVEWAPAGAGARTVARIDGVERGAALALSPDGQWLALRSLRGIELLPIAAPGAAGERQRERVLAHDSEFLTPMSEGSVQFADGGRLLVATSPDLQAPTVTAWDVQAKRRLFEPLRGTLLAAAAHGTTLLVAGGSDRVLVVDGRSGRTIGAPLNLPGGRPQTLRLAPAGRFAVAVGGNDGIGIEGEDGAPGGRGYVLDLERLTSHGRRSTEPVGRPRGPDPALESALRRWPLPDARDASAVAGSGDGRWLAIASGGSGAKLVLVQPRDPSLPPRSIGGHNTRVHALATSPDGQLLASAASELVLRRFDRPMRPLWERPLLLDGTALAFSPDDGSTLALGMDEGRVELYDVASGRRWRAVMMVPTLREADRRPVLRVSFTRDSRRLLSSDLETSWSWDIDIASWRRRACQLAGREPRPQERALHFGNIAPLGLCTPR